MNTRAGDVVFKVETIPHPVFERVQNDLKATVKISLKQALLGFEKELTHLDGRTIKLSILNTMTRNKITRPGDIEKIRSEGMPVYEVPSEKGDLIITYEVELPKVLS